MMIAVFAFGALVFFISVFGAVMAGGLRLTADQLNKEPGLAEEAGLADEAVDNDITSSDVTSVEF